MTTTFLTNRFNTTKQLAKLFISPPRTQLNKAELYWNFRRRECNRSPPITSIKMPLPNLPNELLLCVAERTESERDINALARTNRRLYNLLNRYLYRYNVQWSRGSAFKWAAMYGKAETAQKLLGEGADPEQRYEFEETPLFRAAESGHEAVVQLLLAWGVTDPNSANRKGSTTLFQAAKYGHTAVVGRLLADDRVRLDSESRIERMSPLSVAAWNGHVGVVELLLTKGLKPNVPDSSGMTPLMYAAEEGCEDVVKVLLANDPVGPNAPLVPEEGSGRFPESTRGMTALAFAAECGQGSVVRLLLANDAVDPDPKDGDGLTPLANAASLGLAAVVKLLLAQDNVDPNSKNTRGETPLWCAAKSANFKHESSLETVVQLLLANDAVDPDPKDNINGTTPLALAAREGHMGVAKLLLAHGNVDPNLKDIRGETPLLHAKRRSDGMFKLLQGYK